MTSNSRTWLKEASTDSKEVSEQYDNWASSYNVDTASWQYQAPDEAAYLLSRYVSSSAKILDAGCGTGMTGEALARCGYSKITGIDILKQFALPC